MAVSVLLNYLGNTLRYDVEMVGGKIFKVDIKDPMHHEVLDSGKKVCVIFSSSSTIVIPI